MNKKNIVLIPARSGSQRIKNKNFKICGGKPLIYWTLNAAKKSKKVDQIYVSTDSKKISNYCQKEGALIPYLRPPRLSNSKTLMIDVIKHFYSFILKNNIQCNSLILLQPTSPLRKSEDIDNCLKIYNKLKPNSVVSVCKLNQTVKLNTIMYKKNNFNFVKNFLSDSEIKKKSGKNELLYRNGPAVVVLNPVNLSKNSLFGKKISYYEMPIERSVDIDVDYDFRIADLLLSN